MRVSDPDADRVFAFGVRILARVLLVEVLSYRHPYPVGFGRR